MGDPLKDTDIESLVDWASLSEPETDNNARKLELMLAESQTWRRRQAEAIGIYCDQNMELEETIRRVRAIHVEDTDGNCVGCSSFVKHEECPTIMIINGDIDPDEWVDYEEEDGS